MSIDGTDMQEKDKGDVKTIDGFGNSAVVGDVLVGRGEIRVVELLKGRHIVRGSTAGIRIVLGLIVEIHRDLSHLVVIGLEPGADFAVLSRVSPSSR